MRELLTPSLIMALSRSNAVQKNNCCRHSNGKRNGLWTKQLQAVCYGNVYKPRINRGSLKSSREVEGKNEGKRECLTPQFGGTEIRMWWKVKVETLCWLQPHQTTPPLLAKHVCRAIRHWDYTKVHHPFIMFDPPHAEKAPNGAHGRKQYSRLIMKCKR